MRRFHRFIFHINDQRCPFMRLAAFWAAQKLTVFFGSFNSGAKSRRVGSGRYLAFRVRAGEEKSWHVVILVGEQAVSIPSNGRGGKRGAGNYAARCGPTVGKKP
jgi:hypothetical protein